MLYNIYFAYQYEMNVYILPIKIKFTECLYACKNTGNEKKNRHSLRAWYIPSSGAAVHDMWCSFVKVGTFLIFWTNIIVANRDICVTIVSKLKKVITAHHLSFVYAVDYKTAFYNILFFFFLNCHLVLFPFLYEQK
jgi:hypothetical protein